VSCRGRIVLALAAAAIGLVLPSSASAHAYLIKTVPAASGVLDVPPPNVQLTYDEAVEPRFAIISVTNAAGKQETTAAVSRSPANPDTLVVPLRPHLPEGWYLIYWRAISVDGHPVQGAFTYAVGPNPGPAPQFPVPSIAGSATSLNLLIARWVIFVSVMSAIGLFVFRVLIARPARRRAPGTSLRAVSRAFVIASVIGLFAIPVYLDFATAIDSLRSVFDVTTLVPLFRVTAFGRGYVDMMLCFGLFCVAAWISLWLDQPAREHRSIAEIVSVTGALLAAAAVLLLPGASGHAAQTSPRGISVILDWLHLITGSIWLGGLIGLLVLWASLPTAGRVAGLAAGQQNHFWDFAELFYHEQGTEGSGYVTESYLDALARQVPGLAYSSWLTERDNSSLAAQIQTDAQQAAAAQATGTPTLVFQGPHGQAGTPSGIPSDSDLEQAIKTVA
jgi:copper transport protein